MGEPRFADVPAARHMRVPDASRAANDADGGLPGPAEPAPVRPRDALRPDQDSAYRRKRLVAGALTGMIFLAVPALIVLLVLFG